MKEKDKISSKIHAFRNRLIREKVVKQGDEIDMALAAIVTEAATYVDYQELLVKGVNVLLEMNKVLMEGNIENPLEFGAELQRVRTYVLDAIYQRKPRTTMMLAGAGE